MESDRQQAGTAQKLEGELWDKDTGQLPEKHFLQSTSKEHGINRAFSVSNPYPKGLTHFLQNLGMRRTNQLYIQQKYFKP